MTARSKPAWRRRLGAGSDAGQVTVGLLVVVTVLGSLTLFGTGARQAAVRLLSGSVWLTNTHNDTVSQVNGYTGQVMTQLPVGGPGPWRVVQHDDGAYLVNDRTGELRRIDGSDLEVTQASAVAAGRPRQELYAAGPLTYWVDGDLGLVRRLDPASLAPRGEPVRLGHPVGAGAVDSENALWLPVAGTGAVARVGADGTPRTVQVGAGTDRLAVTAVRRQPVVVNANRGEVRTLTGAGRPVALPGPLPGIPVVAGSDDSDHLVVAAGGHLLDISLQRRAVRTIALGTHRVGGQAVVTGTTAYLVDRHRTAVLPVNLGTGELRAPVRPRSGRVSDVVVKDAMVFVNDRDGDGAVVLGADGQPTAVTKYTEDSTVKARRHRPRAARPPLAERPPLPQPGPGSPVDRRPPGRQVPGPGTAGAPPRAPGPIATTPAVPAVAVPATPPAPRVSVDDRALLVRPATGTTLTTSPAVDRWEASVTAATGGGTTAVSATVSSAPIRITEVAGAALTYGATYQVRIRLHNATGWSGYSPIASTALGFGPLGRPDAGATGHRNGFTVTWTAVDAGGRGAVGYRVSWSGAASGERDVGAATSATVDGLPPGHYEVVVHAAADGDRAASTPVGVDASGPPTRQATVNSGNCRSGPACAGQVGVRTGPRLSDTRLGGVAEGAGVTLLCHTTGQRIQDSDARGTTSWFGVEFNGQRGYISGTWVGYLDGPSGLEPC